MLVASLLVDSMPTESGGQFGDPSGPHGHAATLVTATERSTLDARRHCLSGDVSFRYLFHRAWGFTVSAVLVPSTVSRIGRTGTLDARMELFAHVLNVATSI